MLILKPHSFLDSIMPARLHSIWLLISVSVAQSIPACDGSDHGLLADCILDFRSVSLDLLQTNAASITRSVPRSARSVKQPTLGHSKDEFVTVTSDHSEFILSRDDDDSIALRYVDRLWGKNGQCLSFIHIPKTAGTSIEDVGYYHSVSWGRYDLTNNLCNHPAYRDPHDTNDCYVKDTDEICSVWHVPPSYDSKLLSHYQECETFCVVRNPAQRLVSQWQRHHHDDPCSLDAFRKFVNESFAISSSEPYTQDCHLLQQVEFVYGDKRPGSSASVCQHMLRYENLESEFNDLMKEFDMNIKLTEHSIASNCSIDLPADLLAVIKMQFYDDYHKLNYN